MSEWRVRHSRRLNRTLYGEDVLLCYTVYIRSRIYGGHYVVAEVFINLVFRVIQRETQHCRRCYVWEKRHGNARDRRAARTATG